MPIVKFYRIVTFDVYRSFGVLYVCLYVVIVVAAAAAVVVPVLILHSPQWLKEFLKILESLEAMKAAT